MSAGQFLDPSPLKDGCDPRTCTERVGGEHSDECTVEHRDPKLDEVARLYSDPAFVRNMAQNGWTCRHCLLGEHDECKGYIGGDQCVCELKSHRNSELTGWAPGEVTEAFGR